MYLNKYIKFIFWNEFFLVIKSGRKFWNWFKVLLRELLVKGKWEFSRVESRVVKFRLWI